MQKRQQLAAVDIPAVEIEDVGNFQKPQGINHQKGDKPHQMAMAG